MATENNFFIATEHTEDTEIIHFGFQIEDLTISDLRLMIVDFKTRIWGVHVQLQQALMNLILNDREAMLPRGGVLTIRAEQRTDDIMIRVRDTGCGIAQADIKKVFDSFFSTKDKNNSPRSGTGLGLALCKKVIDAHNGSITIDSQPGKGTTFTITLPKK